MLWGRGGRWRWGRRGVEGLVKAVYGDGGMDMMELSKRLTRSLGVPVEEDAGGGGEVDVGLEGAGVMGRRS